MRVGVPSNRCGDVRTLTGACGIVRSGVPRCLARDKLNGPKSVYKSVCVCVCVCHRLVHKEAIFHLSAM